MPAKVAAGPRRLVLPEPRIDQREILAHPARWKILSCGRQWGKSTLCHVAICAGHGPTAGYWKGAIHGGFMLWVQPDFGSAVERWEQLKISLRDVIRDKSEDEKVLRLRTGGTILLRSGQDPDSCRGFTYDGAVLEEAAFIPGPAKDTKESQARMGGHYLLREVIRPALLVRRGWLIGISTPNVLPNWWDDWVEQSEDAEAAPEGERWVRWIRSTSANPLITPEEVAELEAEMGPITAARELHGRLSRLASAQGVPAAWWRWYTRTEPLIAAAHLVDSSFKPGVTNDPSVVLTVGADEAGNLYALDLVEERVAFPQLQVMAWEHQQKWARRLPDLFGRAPLLIEDQASGQSLIQQLNEGWASLGGKRYPPIPARPFRWPKHLRHASKEARFESVMGFINTGRFYLPQGPREQAWTARLTAQCAAFPNARNDDIADTVIMAIIALGRRPKGRRRREWRARGEAA